VSEEEGMAKKLGTAEEIQAEILRRIRESNDLNGDCRRCAAPTPRSADPKHYGGNWTVDVLPGLVPGCEDVVKGIVRAVRDEYDLKS
jgi:hypothetical protein